MKMKYLKSIGLFVLGFLLSALIFSIPIESLSNENSSLLREELAASLVPIDDARRGVAAFQLWTKYLPKTVKYNRETNSITFPDKISISEEDSVILDQFYNKFIENNDSIRTDSMPFHASVPKSFYIRKSDIESAFSSDTEATGINVYLALNGIQTMEIDKMTTHLFVVPTKMIDFNTLRDQVISQAESGTLSKAEEISETGFALDLTDPCPALCDTESPLFDPISSLLPEQQ